MARTRKRRTATQHQAARRRTAQQHTTVQHLSLMTGQGKPLSLIKAPAATPVRLVKALPQRHTPARDDAFEDAAVHACYAATAGRLVTRALSWKPAPTGGVQQHLPDGTLLTHTGRAGEPFTAVVTCRMSALHTYPVATAGALTTARADAAGCEDPHTDLARLSRPVTATELLRFGQAIAVRTLQEAKGMTLPDATANLRTAEDELKRLRRLIAATVAFIHDPAYDLAARTALAQSLKLPTPTASPIRKEPQHVG